MFQKKAKKTQSRIDCLIGAGTTIEGNINFSGGLRIDGCVKGNVTVADGSMATLVLSELGRIEGEIRVSNVVINGAVLGSIHASEYVELQVKANVTGNVCYKSMEIQQGAVVQGKLVHSDETSDKIVSFKSASGLES
ncbi:MAG: bactofilin family protein [Burkholderiales bacterium]|nr:polymer-forming cytoskeletal protein [Burkholderiales bacterium]